MTLDFKMDNAVALGEQIQLIITKSGYYAIPTSSYKNVLNIAPGNNTNITLVATKSNKSKIDIARNA